MKPPGSAGSLYQWMIFVFVVFVLAGCSAGSTSGSGGEETASGTAVTDFAGRKVTFQEPPSRIVSLIPADLETIRLIGGNVVGGPKDFDDSEDSDLLIVGDVHGIDYERLVSLRPDLVIAHADMNLKDVGLMESLDLKVLLSKGDSLEEILEAIEMYGRILQREDQAKELAAAIVDKANALEPLRKQVKALIVFGSTESFMAALPESLSGNLLKILGAVNIAEGLPSIESYPSYAQLSMERVLQANPDVIFFIAHGDPEAVKNKFEEEVKGNSAWQNVSAVKNGRLIILPSELFSTNPGPKAAEALKLMHEHLQAAAGG